MIIENNKLNIKSRIKDNVNGNNKAASLKKYFQGKSLMNILGENQDERRKSDRF